MKYKIHVNLLSLNLFIKINKKNYNKKIRINTINIKKINTVLIRYNKAFSFVYKNNDYNSPKIMYRHYFRPLNYMNINYKFYNININTTFMKSKIYDIVKCLYHIILYKQYAIKLYNTDNIYTHTNNIYKHIKNINLVRFYKSTLYIIENL